MESKEKKWKKCPICGKTYNTPPAISRKDNKTKICSKCGTEEALLDWIFMEDENHIPRID